MGVDHKSNQLMFVPTSGSLKEIFFKVSTHVCKVGSSVDHKSDQLLNFQTQAYQCRLICIVFGDTISNDLTSLTPCMCKISFSL